jgi:hypothetical protein
MMRRARALWPVLTLTGVALQGCVAAAIPAALGSALVGTRIDGKEAGSRAPRVTTPTPPPAATPAPRVTIAPVVPAPDTTPSATMTRFPSFTPQEQAAFFAAAPTGPNQTGFAQFVRFGRAGASAAASAPGALSAVLADPVALDGRRRRCDAQAQPVAVIDLDPVGGIFTPPANPAPQSGLALGLAVLREAGVAIVWRSDLLADGTGAVRTALEQAGLDPRGQDIVSLRRDPEDRKQARMDNLAGTACIIAIAGDERADFDDRYRYLRNPEAGAGLEPIIGDGWFLIEPVFPLQQQDTP